MTVTFERAARIGPRLWPDGQRRAQRRVRAWLEEHAGHLWLGAEELPDGRGFRAWLYPHCGWLDVRTPGRGRLHLHSETSLVGPGYHVWLTKLVRAMGIELPIRWQDADDGAAPHRFGDDADEGAVERAMLQLASRAVAAATEDVVRTALGPLPRERLARLEEDPLVRRAVFPWWDRGHPAHYYLQRALVTLWWEVEWRPARTERELALQLHAHEMLLMARSVDPELGLPWPEWAELIDLLGIQGSITTEVRAAAERHKGAPRIGFRRDST